MMMRVHVALALVASALAGAALATLPPLSAEQEQAAAAKKQAEQAQLEKEKQALERAQDRVAAYYKRDKGKPGGAVGSARVSDTNMPKTTRELPRDTAPQGGRQPSAEAHSAPAK
jgi:type II secretory pathway component PulJ